MDNSTKNEINSVAKELGMTASEMSGLINVCNNPEGRHHVPRNAWTAVTFKALTALQNHGYIVPEFMVEQAKLNAEATIIEDVEVLIQKSLNVANRDKKPVSSRIWSRFFFDSDLVNESRDLQEYLASSQLPSNYEYDEELRSRVYGCDDYTALKLSNEFVKEMKTATLGPYPHMALEDIIPYKEAFCARLGLSRKDVSKKIINIQAKKGGVGKSSVTTGVAGAFAMTASRPYRVLVIDADGQGSTTHLLSLRGEDGCKLYSDRPSIFDVLMASKAIDARKSETTALYNQLLADSIVDTPIPNVSMIQANDFPFDQKIKIGRSNSATEIKADELRHVIEDAMEKGDFDIAIIDSRPDLHTATKLSFAAADKAINVMRPCGEDRDAYRGYLKEIAADVVPEICGDGNWTLPEMSVLFNQVTKTQNQHRVNMGQLAACFDRRGFIKTTNTMIFESRVITSASTMDCSIWSMPRESISGINAQVIGSFRAQFTSLALELEDEWLKNNK
ncbi:ParA family protein [Photobacterium kishitanii]|uniref:AAA domain-containing protein n=1 Tax=Photobacterium kishitanii TaxID=318456 RepID=A0A2T3KMY5_9GAMM|nr:ParA family protein [Photobacterium kishitanii]PSV01163.1 hypothetical protein C9J27_03830 [Photobacterium kishitanii]